MSLASILDSAKEFTLEAALSASARLVEVPLEKRVDEIHKLLNSRLDHDRLTGIRCVIQVISRGDDGSEYFADVVKNITAADPSVTRLVMIYLTRYAEQEPDTALLSINSIQKSLGDKNPQHRARAIRALSGIRISEIHPVLVLCLKRTVGDPSVVVRAATAVSLMALSAKESNDHLKRLLGDPDSAVVASAIRTLYKRFKQEVTSDSHKALSMLHSHFRRYCSILHEFDEYAQSFAIDLLTDYARRFLPRPVLSGDDFQMELPEWQDTPKKPYEVSFDADLELFLHSLMPLLAVRSDVVLFSIARAAFALAPPKTFAETSLAENLIRSRAYDLIGHITKSYPAYFSAFYKKFYVYPTDAFPVAEAKLGILANIVNLDNAKYIVEELKYYSRQDAIAESAIKVFGAVAEIPGWHDYVIRWCLGRLQKARGSAMNGLLSVVRRILQKTQDTATVHHLAAILRTNGALDSEAKACIIWTIGEFTRVTQNTVGPDVLRIAIKTFASEPQPVRYQLLVLAAKAYTYELAHQGACFETCQKMYKHVLHLAKYDESYDVRDRARLFGVLLTPGSEKAELASLFLEAPKPAPFSNEKQALELNLLPWSNPESLPDSSVRSPADIKKNERAIESKVRSVSPVGPVSSQVSSKVEPKREIRLQTLDDFFGENEEEEEEEEESEDEEDEEEDEDEESEDESESGESESSDSEA